MEMYDFLAVFSQLYYDSSLKPAEGVLSISNRDWMSFCLSSSNWNYKLAPYRIVWDVTEWDRQKVKKADKKSPFWN